MRFLAALLVSPIIGFLALLLLAWQCFFAIVSKIDRKLDELFDVD